MRNKSKRTVTVEYLNEDNEYAVDQFCYFVGIDPSYSSTGFVILNSDSDVPLVSVHIKAGSPTDNFSKRMNILLDKIQSYMVEYPIDDVHVVMEGASFASDFNCFKLGKLSGVLEHYLGSSGYCYHLVAPTYAKKVATGKGTATKEQVKQGILNRWGYSHMNEDINDAYVMAQIARGAKPIPKPKRNRKGSDVVEIVNALPKRRKLVMDRGEFDTIEDT